MYIITTCVSLPTMFQLGYHLLLLQTCYRTRRARRTEALAARHVAVLGVAAAQRPRLDDADAAAQRAGPGRRASGREESRGATRWGRAGATRWGRE